MSAAFVLGSGEQHPGAPAPSRGPFIRIASPATDGLLALAEARLPARTAGPNLHVHTNEDELFFVLDGVMTIQLGEQRQEIAAGGLAWGARGTPHAFANLAPEPLRIMILWTPGGVERLFEEMDAYRQSVSGTPAEEALAAIMARYGGKSVGPPIPVPQL
jgi:mannose-6-phosphate isomerase-like protein (cupin superfamily)